MYLKVQRAEVIQIFNIWAYTADERIIRGSALFAGKEGVALYHYFLLPIGDSGFEFKQGSYQIDIFAELINKKTIKIYSQELIVDDIQEQALSTIDNVLYFNWNSGIQSYQTHIDSKPMAFSEIFK